MTRARFSAREKCDNGQGESINFSFICPYNMKLVCVKANWQAIPVTDEYLEVTKNSAALGDFVVLRENPKTAVNPFPPPMVGLTEFMNTDRIELLKGETVTVTYLNTDDQDCTAEIILEQV